MSEKGLASDFCRNPKCRLFGKTGQDNLYVRERYGTEAIRLLRCRECQEEFSERQGTPLACLKLPKAKVIEVLEHLADGCGVRKTARLTHVARTTVGRIVARAGAHARAFHNVRVKGVPVGEAQFDEMWAFVGKKRQEMRSQRS